MERAGRLSAFTAALILAGGCTDSLAVDAVETTAQPPRLPRIRAGVDDTCAIDGDGQLLCWGTSLEDQTGSFLDVSLGFEGLAVRADGAAEWFPPQGDEFAFPHADYVQVINAYGPPCALRRDGQVDCLDVVRNQMPIATPPEQRIVRLDNSFALCGIAEDTSAVCWGDLDALPGTGIAQLAGMESVGSCAVYEDGRVECNGSMGQPPRGNRYKSIAVVHSDVCGVLLDGELDCWGAEGALAFPLWNPLPTGPFDQITLGSGQACAVRDDLSVICGGYYGTEGGIEGHPLSLAGHSD